MNKEEIVFKLQQVRAIFSIFSCLNEDARITDIAYISKEYEDCPVYYRKCKIRAILFG